MIHLPTWKEILHYIESFPNGADHARRIFLQELHKYTGRDVILYASAWTIPNLPSNLVSIVEEDIEGFIEVTRTLEGDELDLILHSPGGSATVVEAIIHHLRSRYKDIHVIIPQSAMSAATMLACAADKIIMASHSSLGPIDPQVVISTENGYQIFSAEAILEQFNQAKQECMKNPNALSVWMPILKQYPPGILVECQNALSLAKELVGEWLEKYMFKHYPKNEAHEKAQEIAKFLSSHKKTKTHDRHISREQAKEIGLIIEDLEADPQFYDLVISLFHATTLTFAGTPAVKIIENHNGHSYIKIYRR